MNYIKNIFLVVLISLGSLNCTFNSDNTGNNESEVKEKNNKSNTGVKVNYRDDGSKKSEISYVNGIKDGPAINYYTNGNVQLKIDYKEGKKHGKHLYYYQDGNLYKSSDYFNDQLDGFVEHYRTDGSIKLKIPYKNGYLGVGTEEYAMNGDIKKYLKNLDIQVKKVNTVAQNGSYSLYFSLTDYSNVKDVYYYVGDLTDGQFMNDSLDELFTKNRSAETHLDVKPNHYVDETINVIAEITTRDKYPILLKKEVKVSVRN